MKSRVDEIYEKFMAHINTAEIDVIFTQDAINQPSRLFADLKKELEKEAADEHD